MAKKRVHEIAKEQGITSKEALAALKKAGLEVSTASSSVDEADAAKAFANGASATKAPAKAKKAAPKSDAKPAEKAEAKPAADDAGGQARAEGGGQARAEGGGQARAAEAKDDGGARPQIQRPA